MVQQLPARSASIVACGEGERDARVRRAARGHRCRPGNQCRRINNDLLSCMHSHISQGNTQQTVPPTLRKVRPRPLTVVKQQPWRPCQFSNQTREKITHLSCTESCRTGRSLFQVELELSEEDCGYGGMCQGLSDLTCLARPTKLIASRTWTPRNHPS
eukprot:751216-Hanusia_phi.AAC.2